MIYRPRHANPLNDFRWRFNQKLARWRLNGDFVLAAGPALLLVLLLGQTIFLFPFRIFTTTLHEAGHMLAAVVLGVPTGQLWILGPFGGGFAQIQFSDTPRTIIIASAGYVGSTLFGGLLLLFAKNPRYHRRVLFGVIGSLFVVMILFARNPSGIFVFMIVIFASAIAFKAPDIIVSFSLYALALLSCFNSISDLLYLMKLSDQPAHAGPLGSPATDAAILQTYTGIPATTWALSWSAIAAFMLVIFGTNCLFLRKPSVNRPVRPARFGGQAYQPTYPPAAPFGQPPAAFEPTSPAPPRRPVASPTTPVVSADDEILLQAMFTRMDEK